MILSNFYRMVKDFWKEGGVSVSFDHFLAMLPATIMMPVVINQYLLSQGMQPVFDISIVLIASAIGSCLFALFTNGRFPGYLGSSFAFISVTEYICVSLKGESTQTILAYLLGTYLCSGILLLFMSFICHLDEKKTSEIVNDVVPPEIMGPAISLIGLELSNDAFRLAGCTIEQSKTIYKTPDIFFAIGIVVLFIVFSLQPRKVLKNSSLFLSFLVVAGLYWTAIKLQDGGYQPVQNWQLQPLFSKVSFHFPAITWIMPKFKLSFIIMIIPTTCILFSEHIARKIMTENLKNFKRVKKKDNVPLAQSLAGNSISFFVSSLIHGTPLTIYAENIAVMRINDYPMDSLQFIVTAILAVVIACSGCIQNIPDCLSGGLSLSLMGIIAVPGIDLLINKRVNYKKISSLLLTASVLIAGISKISISIFNTQFSGMSLGLIVGILLNLIIKLLTLVGMNKEPFIAEDVFEIANRLNSTFHTSTNNSSLGITETRYYYTIEDEDHCFLLVKQIYLNTSIVIKLDPPNNDTIKQSMLDFNHKSPDPNGIFELELRDIDSIRKLKKLIQDSYRKVVNEV